MRILFTFVGGNGHFQPLVPIAQAAAAVGHVVAVAGQNAMVPAIRSEGFTAFATNTDPARPPQRLPLVEVSAEREDRVLRENFARRAGRERATAILELCAGWRPDLIVCDEVDFGGMIAAEQLGLPYASVLVIAAGSFVRKEVVAEPLDEVRAGFGLPPDPDLTMLSRYLVLSPVPPSYRDPAFPLPATGHSIHPFSRVPPGHAVATPQIPTLPGRPTVYLTLGTIFNMESGDLFPRILAGLRDLPINLVVTVGRHFDPAELGPQPANVHIEQYIPQASILAQSSAVVSHGGSGSVIGALAFGLPMVLIPMGADQPLNAARCDALGVAQVLDAIEATPELVGEAVSTVLADPRYRHAAERMRDEIAALPGPDYAVALMERLAVEKCPVVSA